MPDREEPKIAFTDRRKISSEGEIRPEAAAQEEMDRREAERSQADKAPQSKVKEFPGNAASSHAQPGSVHDQEKAGAAADGQAAPEETVPEGPTAQETAESNAAYQQTTQQLDEILRTKAPDANHLGPVSFEHLVQSMYMTAMMALGAGTQPGEKPRIDLMGARQTIDLLGVLGEKTKGNLVADEQRLLESALFELRMMFLEITNAIARNAANPAQPPKQK